MTDIAGTNLAAQICPFTTDDAYNTHDSKYGKGGWHEVATTTERDAITTQRRTAGMAVYVTSESKVYILGSDLTTWTEFETGKIDKIQKNGTDIPITNKTVNVEVPTKISDLTDDTSTNPIDKADTLTNLTATVTELNYIDGVTSNVQTQLNSKVTGNTTITAGTHTKITYDSKGLVTGGSDLQASDIPSIPLSKISDVTATAAELNVLDGITATTTELNYVDGVTSNIQTQLNSKLNTADIINNTSTTTTNQALSANMGKELQDQINNLKEIGRFLSLWDCTTGLPTTNPTTSPYTYHTGDYYIVSKADNTAYYEDYDSTETYNTGDKVKYNNAYYICKEDNVTGTWNASKWNTHTITNYKPNGSSYTTGVPSTTLETEVVAVNDLYVYDGTNWKLLVNTQRTVTFENIAGSPYDNTNLSSALNSKQNTIDSSHKLSSDLVDDTNKTNKFVTTTEKTRLSDLNVQYTSTTTPAHDLDLSTITIDKGSAEYGFYYNSSYDRIESSNGGIDYSYSYGKITLNIPSETTLEVTFYQDSEQNYDFGVISNLDTYLTYDYEDYSTNALWNGYNYQSITDTIIYNVSAGEHFFTFKYRKDASGFVGDDVFAITKIRIGVTEVKKFIDYDTKQEIDIKQDLSNYYTKTQVDTGFVTLNTKQTITSLKNICYDESATAVGNQAAMLNVISTQNAEETPSWVGRTIMGAKNLTFLMGTYNGMAGLGAHSWNDAIEQTGAAWADMYFQPDGDKAVYLGGWNWQKNCGWFKVQNDNQQNAKWRTFINTGAGSSSTTWKTVLPNMNTAIYSVFFSPNISNSSTYNYSTSMGYGATPNGTYAANIGYNSHAGQYGSSLGSTANANGFHSIAIGASATASGSYSIQIGQGTNSTANTLYVGLSSTNNYQLLDSSGKIPVARVFPTLESGKFLTNNGTTLSWSSVDTLPSQTGNSGKFLTTNGTSASWATVDALPSQTGNSGKFLTTNGTAASWATITIPTKISDLTDDTSTNPIDKADTLTGLTATVAELNVLDGITATTTELNYVDGVTSNIQTQLNNKQASLGYTPENVANKKTSITSSSTDTDYPSAKAVYNYVGNGTITIQKNGTTVDSFTTNQSANKTINIPVPKTLIFTNFYAENWIYDGTYSDFMYRCDIYLTGVTSSMSANVTYALQNALSGYYAPTCEVHDGYISIYSISSAAITIPTITVWSE